MAETAFSVAYDGPAVADGTMPARDLAPALLALGDVFAEVSVLLYPDRPPVALSIRATEEGSFLVRLILEGGGVWDQVVDMFSGEAADALANIKELVIGGGFGLFFFYRWLRGRMISSVETVRPGYVRITTDDGQSIEIPSTVLRLHHNANVRQKAKRVVAPLSHPGIESVTFDDQQNPFVIREDETEAFTRAPSDDDEVLLDQEQELVVEIVSPTFAEGNKWRLSDGPNTFYAAWRTRRSLNGSAPEPSHSARGTCCDAACGSFRRDAPTGCTRSGTCCAFSRTSQAAYRRVCTTCRCPTPMRQSRPTSGGLGQRSGMSPESGVSQTREIPRASLMRSSSIR